MDRLGTDITLEQIDNFFNANEPLKPANFIPNSGLKKSVVQGKPDPVPHYKRSMSNPISEQTSYARDYQARENSSQLNPPSPDHVLRSPTSPEPQGDWTNMSAIETMSEGYQRMIDPDMPPPELGVEVYKHYNFRHKYDPTLPITSKRETLINTIQANQVTVVQGSTGSGKTTQVPQYILDHYVTENQFCNIIVTQPRKIAAKSVAKRVSEERGWQLGSLVGYQVGLDKVANEDTRIMYVTTGVLLNVLVANKNMVQYTHVIIDEVHERDKDTDFLLLVVRKLLRLNSHQVKVVVMSATFDSSLFANYFSMAVNNQLEPAPVVNVEGRMHHVTEHYLEDLTSLQEVPFQVEDAPYIPPQAYQLAFELIKYFDELELQAEGKPLEYQFVDRRGTVLVFLPGLYEIQELEGLLLDVMMKKRLTILPLHSTITTEEQSKIFDKPEKGWRKIILSTNIAESSITVPDIKYVIDFMLTKCMVLDLDTNYEILQLNWASKANSDQRKGRAGRVSQGKTYRLVTRNFWETSIPEYSLPEMQRCPLEKIVLKVKDLRMEEPKAILALALEPPRIHDIEKTVLLLKEAGALSTLRDGKVNPYDGDLTFVGKILSRLPVDIKIGKLMVLGHVFDILEECIIIGASLSLKSIFARPHRQALEAYKLKMKWAAGSGSDCIAILNVYREWERLCEQRAFSRSTGSMYEWGRKNFIQIKRLKEVETLVIDLKSRLGNFGMHVPRRHHRQQRDADEDMLILKIALAAAFYPNYFNCGDSDEADALKQMSGRDPSTTVMVCSIPSKYGVFYRSQLAALFSVCGRGKNMYFEGSKCFIEFERLPGEEEKLHKILLAVYNTIKMRQLRMPLFLDEIDIPQKVKDYCDSAQFLQKDQSKLKTNRMSITYSGAVPKALSDGTLGANQVPPPAPEEKWIELFITEILEPNHFWAHYAEDENFRNLIQLMNKINGGTFLEPLNRAEITPRMICIAPFNDGCEKKFYRCEIKEIRPSGEVDVFYLDYGNLSRVRTSELKKITKELLALPFQAFECYLQGIKTAKKNTETWNPRAKELFVELLSNKILRGKVYSVVQGTLRIDLEVEMGDNWVNFNELLVKECYAVKAEEPYSSKLSHAQREESKFVGDSDPVVTSMISQLSMGRMQKTGNRQFVNGPFNPYEIKFYGMTAAGQFKNCRLLPDSVNSVTLKEHPENKARHIMTAAAVTLSSSANNLMCRETTLMPHIPGLPALVAMTFAPCMELRVSADRKRYIGALCGLGWDPEDDCPLLPDHDMEVPFDVHIETEDISMVNNVRVALNVSFGDEQTLEMGQIHWQPVAMARIQTMARDSLLMLINKPREPVEISNFSKPYMWNQVKNEVSHGLQETAANCPSLYELFNTPFLDTCSEQVEAEMERKRRHHESLEEIANSAGRFEPVKCELCDVNCMSASALNIHLNTHAHQIAIAHLYQ